MNAGGHEGYFSPGGEADVFAESNGGELVFGRDAQKKVTTLTLKAQGFIFKGTKE